MGSGWLKSMPGHLQSNWHFHWRMASSGMLRCMALVRTNVLEECSASIIRVTGIGELGTMLGIPSNWRTLRRNIVPRKSGIEPTIRPQLLPWKFFSIHYSLIILPISTLCLDLRFSWWSLWRMVSSGMWHHVALVRTDVSEERNASIIRVTGIVN
jgi:hypothetical protein